MSSILRRAVAAFTALIIGAAGLAVGAAPAAADPAGILWMGGPGTSPASPYASDHVSLSVHVQGPAESLCTPANAPTLTWDDGAGHSGTLPAPGSDGTSLLYGADLGTFPAGDTTVTVTASGGCAQPADSGTPPSVAVYRFTVIADPPWPPANDSLTISGTVRQVRNGVATPLRDTTVGLYYAGVGATSSEPIGPLTTTDAIGRYTVSLHGDVGAPEVFLAVFPADTSTVYYLAGATAASGSATSDLTATPLPASSWDTSALYDVFVDYGYTPVAGGWQPVSTQSLTASVTEYDETFTPTDDETWDWSSGGTITVDTLPLGLTAQVTDAGVADLSPSVRITGTPTRDGASVTRISATDTSGAIRFLDVEYAVAAPVCSEVWQYRDLSFHDTATRWLGLCRYDAVLRDALGRHTSRASDAVGAFRALGEISVDGRSIWAEDVSITFDEYGEVLRFVDHGVDLGELGSADILVERRIDGSSAIWNVTVFVAGTDLEVVIPEAVVTIGGALGSNGWTTWFTSGPTSMISTDAAGSARPIVVHSTDGTFAYLAGDASYLVFGNGSLSYRASIVDYGGCAYRDTLAAVSLGMPYLLDPDSMGDEFSLPGEECVPVWEGTDIVARVGDTIDVTIRATADGPFWDFDLGGTLSADTSELLGGLSAELVDQNADEVGPALRVWGTVTAEGEFGIPITATDGTYTSGVTAWVHLLPALDDGDGDADESAEKQMSLDLGAEIGDVIGGTEVTVTGSGLRDPSTWDIIVRSTPRLIGSGSAGAGGAIATTATIPAGLEAGWHSITFTGTWFDATAASAVLWFKLDSAGRLIATSRTAPAADSLGSTGAVHDGTDGRFALLLLVAGLGALLTAQRRTHRRAA